MKRHFLVLSIMVLIAGATARGGTSGTWIYNGNGNWSDTSKWLDSIIADGVDATAYFTADISQWSQVTLDSDRTLGGLVFSDDGGPVYRWQLQSGSGATLTLQTTSGTPTIESITNAELRCTLAGEQGFTKTGAKQLELGYYGCSNTYTGVTTVEAGTLLVSNDNALGATGSDNRTVVQPGATLKIKEERTINETLILRGTSEGGDGRLVLWDDADYAGDITVDGRGTIEQYSAKGADVQVSGGVYLSGPDSLLSFDRPKGQHAMVDGTISGEGAIKSNSDSRVVLWAANTFTGTTTVQGYMEFRNNDALQNSTVVMDGGSIGFGNSITAPNFGGLSGSSDLDLNSRALTVGSNGEDTTYSGVLAGSGSSLTKTGIGTLTLSGSNTYDNGTTINNGVLVAGHNNALGSGSVSINGGTLQVGQGIAISNDLSFTDLGGTFGGSGKYSGNITIGQNGTLAPGSSPGMFTIDGDYTQDILGLLEIELGGLIRGDEYDVLNVTGQMSLAGTLDVVLYGGFEPLQGNSFDILDWGSLSGTFDTVNLPALNAGLCWDTSGLYTDGTLNVQSGGQVIPAPGAMLLAGIGTGLVVCLKRKKIV